MHSRFAAVLVLVATACATRPAAPPERDVFRLETAGIAPGATSGSPSGSPSGAAAHPTHVGASIAAPPASSSVAFTTSLRVVRPDGTTIQAPRLTAFAGQRANIQILNQTAYVQDFDVESQDGAAVADPVIGMLHEGLMMELLVAAVPGNSGEAALALRVVSTAARRPFGTRITRMGSGDRGAPVTIQTPRVESVEIAGAQRIALGAETEWARVPDPAGGADLVVMGRVDRAEVDGPTTLDEEDRLRNALGTGGSSRAAADPAEATATAAMASLAAAAASGAPVGTLRVTAVRPSGEPVATHAPAGAPLCALSLRTVAAPGVRAADRLRTSYLSGWVADGFCPGPLHDPLVATAESGLDAEIAADGALRLRWTTIPGWDEVEEGGAGAAPSFDSPVSRTAVVAVPRFAAAAPGRTVHPMFTLPDGGTAAIVVEWEPDRR